MAVHFLELHKKISSRGHQRRKIYQQIKDVLILSFDRLIKRTRIDEPERQHSHQQIFTINKNANLKRFKRLGG